MDAKTQARLLREGADWFRRMGNANAVTASLSAASKLHPAGRDVIVLPSAKRDAKARGGLARAASLTPERRSEIARIAAARRWGKS